MMVNTISVSGTGQQPGDPDLLIVDLGVSVRRSTVDEATSEAARTAQAVIQAVEAHGIERRDIQTTHYSIHPEYDHRSDMRTFRGYRATNTVSLRVRDIDGAGAVIDSATAAAGNEGIVNGIRFEIEETGELLKAARKAAWDDALARATELADLAGLELGKAVSITETAERPGPIALAVHGMVETTEPTPIQPGGHAVSVSLTVDFAVR